MTWRPHLNSRTAIRSLPTRSLRQDWISNSQLVEMTGLRKQHVSRAVRELIQRNIVAKSGNKFAFNKDYTQWRELPKQVTVTNSGYKVTSTSDPSNQFRGTQKKKVLKKDAPSPDVRAAIDYFCKAVEDKKGFAPRVGPKDAAQAKKNLKSLSLYAIKSQIDFFVSTSISGVLFPCAVKGTLAIGSKLGVCAGRTPIF